MPEEEVNVYLTWLLLLGLVAMTDSTVNVLAFGSTQSQTDSPVNPTGVVLAEIGHGWEPETFLGR